MAKADKEYADSLFYTVNKEVEELKGRVTILESQNGAPVVPTETEAGAWSPSGMTITFDDFRAMVNTEITLCLKQHQEQVQAEEAARKQKRDEEFAQKIIQKRKEYEAAGRKYITSLPEGFDLIHQTQNAHSENTNEKFKILATIGETFYRALIELQKTSDNILEFVTPPPPPPIEPNPVSIFANLPSGLRAKIKELRNRIQDHLHTYLAGRYSFHRGYALFAIIAYIMMFVACAIIKVSIIIG